jgi:hypothetical protein
MKTQIKLLAITVLLLALAVSAFVVSAGSNPLYSGG